MSGEIRRITSLITLDFFDIPRSPSHSSVHIQAVRFQYFQFRIGIITRQGEVESLDRFRNRQPWNVAFPA